MGALPGALEPPTRQTWDQSPETGDPGGWEPGLRGLGGGSTPGTCPVCPLVLPRHILRAEFRRGSRILTEGSALSAVTWGLVVDRTKARRCQNQLA